LCFFYFTLKNKLYGWPVSSSFVLFGGLLKKTIITLMIGEKMSDDKILLPSFYDRSGVEKENIPIAGGIPIGIESVFSTGLGIGGAYGSWGESFSNAKLPSFVERRLGESLSDNDILNLSELGFESRQHVPDMSDTESLELEL